MTIEDLRSGFNGLLPAPKQRDGMKKTVVLLITVTACALLGFWVYRQVVRGVVLTIDQSRIQTRLEQNFPVEKQLLLLKIILSDPRTELRVGSNRIHVSVNVRVSLSTQKTAAGSAEISGAIAYSPESGEFYLKDAKVEKLVITTLSQTHTNQVAALVGQISGEMLNRHPIYKLDQSDWRQFLVRIFLKSVKVTDGRLQMVMGI